MSQQAHRSDPRILNRRTLQRDHPYLVRVLRPGMTVLDVGCGSGAITADIARAVGPNAVVLGLDRDQANLAIARQEHAGMGNLRFEHGDLLTLDVEQPFDLVTAARTIQWISEPVRAIRNMKNAAKAGGRVIALDYDLADTRWEPDPPVEFQRFYDVFLEWRRANGWDNRTGSHLAELFQAAGLADIEAHQHEETARRGDPDFFDAYASGIWLYVIQSLSTTLVEAGLVEADLCSRAEEEYRRYAEHTLRLQKHSLVTVEGQVKEAQR